MSRRAGSASRPDPKTGPERSSSLRAGAARGTIVNGTYLAMINAFGLVKGVVAAGLLTTSEFGIWAILAVTITTLLALKRAGIGDKFIQQTEGDQRLAFRKAFTLELIATSAISLLAAASVPLLVLLTGESSLLLPGLVLVLVLPASALQAPLWIFYRRMDYTRQRILQSIDPVVTLVISIALAAAGLGYWGLVVGAVAGSFVAALATVWQSPYPLGLSWDRDAAREYFGFSWPLVLAAASTLVLGQATILIGQATLGLAGAGAIYLAVTIALFANKLDEVLTQTLYPAICAVSDRMDLLAETFAKSNKLAMLWGVPFGVGVALFAGDLIEFLIGEKWALAEGLIQATALIVAANQIGFNWNAYLQALGRTRPLAVAAVSMLIATAAVAYPLLITHGLGGFALGLAIANGIAIAFRLFYVRRLFGLRDLFTNALAACVPAAVGALGVVGSRWIDDGERTAGLALGELALYVLAVVGLAAWRERGLLGEIIGYLRVGRVPVLDR